MNLQHITTDLDRTLRRRLRRTDTLQRWNEHLGSASDLDTLFGQIRDADRSVSHPVLAVLVDLAKHGDTDAAQAVTVALLQRFADKERGKGGDWDGFAGHLYEAIVTCHSTSSNCLREIIERNALRRHLRDRIAGVDDVQLANAETIPSVLPTPEDVAVRGAQRRHVQDLIADLVAQRAISETTQRILAHIAAGTDRHDVPEFHGWADNTIRARSRRAARSLTSDHLRQELASVVA
jgi:hypothetical protein